MYHFVNEEQVMWPLMETDETGLSKENRTNLYFCVRSYIPYLLNSQEIFCDATFRAVAGTKAYRQVLVISCKVQIGRNSKYVPVFCIIMGDKSTNNYRRVFRECYNNPNFLNRRPLTNVKTLCTGQLKTIIHVCKNS